MGTMRFVAISLELAGQAPGGAVHVTQFLISRRLGQEWQVEVLVHPSCLVEASETAGGVPEQHLQLSEKHEAPGLEDRLASALEPVPGLGE